MKAGWFFVPDYFRDNSEEKWIHPGCCSGDSLSLRDEESPCVLCNQQYFPGESVLKVEYGTFNDKEMFVPASAGYAHFTCLCDEWELPLWDIMAE